MKFQAHRLEDTKRFGITMGRKLLPGDIILLFGDLGAGKTTLTQSLAIGLGASPNEYVRSPTFTLINCYSGRFPIYHVDLYRLNSFEEMENIGLEEFLFGEGVVIIEWAEKLINKKTGKFLFGIESRLEIHIENNYREVRKINVKSYGLKNRIP